MDSSTQHKYFSSEFLNNTVRYGLITVGVLGALLSLAGDFTESNVLLQSYVIEQANVVCVVLHLILIALILGPARVRPLDTDIHNPYVRASAVLLNRQFLPAWRMIWVFFGMLYVLLLFTTQDLHQVRPITEPGWTYDHTLFEQVLLNLGDLGSTWAIALCAACLAPRYMRREVFRLARKDAVLHNGREHFVTPYVGAAGQVKWTRPLILLSVIFASLMVLLAFVVERDVFQKSFQPVRHRPTDGKIVVQRRDQFLEIAHAILPVLHVLLRTTQFVQVTGLIEKTVRPQL